MESKDPRKDFLTVQQRNAVFSKFGRKWVCPFLVGTEPNQKVIRAHRGILAAVSPVFKAMFFGGMAERKYPIPIPDIEPETFVNMLRYIYGIKISKYDITFSTIEDACNVYYAATKYILPRLKSKCTGYIYSRLCRYNKYMTKYICLIYEFASLYDEENLKFKCLEVMRNETREIINDNSFNEAQLSTLVTIFSLEEVACTELDLFNALQRYVKAQCENKADPTECADKADPKECADKADPTECADKAYPTECADKADPTESEDKADYTECGDKADPIKCADKAYPTECADKADYTECEDKADPTECADKADPTEWANMVDPTECEENEDHTESEDKADHTECSTSGNMEQVNGAETEPKRQHGELPTDCKKQLNIRPALEQIRFLTLTAEQFAEGPARSGLLTEAEVSAILSNITSDKPNVPMPSGFSTCKESRWDSLRMMMGEIFEFNLLSGGFDSRRRYHRRFHRRRSFSDSDDDDYYISSDEF